MGDILLIESENMSYSAIKECSEACKDIGIERVVVVSPIALFREPGY